MNPIILLRDAVGQVLINICEEICDPVMKGVVSANYCIKYSKIPWHK